MPRYKARDNNKNDAENGYSFELKCWHTLTNCVDAKYDNVYP